MLFVAPADSSATVFKGDGSDEPNALATARQTLRDVLAVQVVSAMRGAGFQANMWQGNPGGSPTGPVTVWMVVRECNWGSNAALGSTRRFAGHRRLYAKIHTVDLGAGRRVSHERLK